MFQMRDHLDAYWLIANVIFCAQGSRETHLTVLAQNLHQHLSRQETGEYDLTLKVLVATTDAQWEGMGDVGSATYELALLPPCPTIRVLSFCSL